MLEPQRVELDGASVAFEDSGRGVPLLFVHGYLLSARTWRKVVPALSTSYRCIALDLLGAGETDVDPRADLAIPAQVRMLAAFLEALDLSSVTLIAHDSGAVLTRLLALNEPGRVARIVLSDTEIPGCPVRSAHWAQRLVRAPGGARVFEGTLRSRFLMDSLFLRAAIHDRARFDSEEFLATHMEPLRSARARAALRRFGVAWDLGLVDALPHDRLGTPKLVLWGARDAFIPPERARRFCEALPPPRRFASIPDCGTLPHEERPEAWLEAVRGFLTETEASVAEAAGAPPASRGS